MVDVKDLIERLNSLASEKTLKCWEPRHGAWLSGLLEAAEALSRLSGERAALFKCAASCQGGHSDAGAAAADALGIPFPITMSNLISKAREEGLNPRDVWPWFYRIRALKPST